MWLSSGDIPSPALSISTVVSVWHARMTWSNSKFSPDAVVSSTRGALESGTDLSAWIGVERCSRDGGKREIIFWTYVRLHYLVSSVTKAAKELVWSGLPSAAKRKPLRFPRYLEKMVVMHELNLTTTLAGVHFNGSSYDLRTNVFAGKSRAHLSGGVLQIAAVIG